MWRALAWSALTAAVSFGGLVCALLLAHYGASRWLYALLLLVPLTVGLPATCAALVCVSFMEGPYSRVVLIILGVAGWLGQLAAVLVWGWWRRRRRAS